MTLGEFIISTVELIADIAKTMSNVQSGTITIAEGEAAIAAHHAKRAADRAAIDAEAATKFGS